MGLGQVGARLKEQLGGSGPILALVGAQSGLDIDKDLLAWMGEGAVFVTGDSPATIGGALVVQSKDPTATRAAIPKLASLITRFASRLARPASCTRRAWTPGSRSARRASPRRSRSPPPATGS